MILTYIRHAQTNQNAEWIIQGHLDTDLSQAGLEQIEKLSDYLKNEKFVAIYTSDLKRAHQTAQAIHINQKNIPFIVSPALRERSFWNFEGQVMKQVLEKNAPKDYDSLLKENESVESFDQIILRVKNFLQMLLETYKKDDHILVVSHSWFLTALTSVLENISLENLWKEINWKTRSKLENTSITSRHFDFDEKSWKNKFYNKLEHLETISKNLSDD